jgi:nucleoredoxin
MQSELEEIFGKKFLKHSASGGKEDVAVIPTDGLLAIYFSAHWCPPCRSFTPILSKFY